MKTTWLFLGLIGCGVSSDRYITKYAEAECTYSLACFDEDVLTFNNWLDQTVDGEEVTAQEMCERDIVPLLMLSNQQCSVYDKAAAKQCLDEWETQGCPENAADPDVPAICGKVFTNCVGDQPEE